MVLKLKYTRVILLGCMMLMGGFLFAQAPSNPNATPSAVKQYNYLYNYKKNPSNCVLIGQNLGHRDQILDFYESYIQRLKNESGHSPAIIGGDLGLGGDLDIDLVADLLETHTKSGGMVTLSWQARNPWTGTFYAQKRYRDLGRLLTPGDSLNTFWLAELDEVAETLQELQARDVTILWRPFSDMNGDWFWWGAHPNADPEDFKKLWKFTYDYLTLEKGLNNLLWIFSVNQSTILSYEPDAWLRGETYFPGEDYVDVIAMTLFDDKLKLNDAHDFLNLKRFNKPLALATCGPRQETSDGEYDYLEFFGWLQEHFPEIVYANVMHSFDDYKLALTDNKNYVALLTQPCVVNNGEIDLDEKWVEEKERLLDEIRVFPQPVKDFFNILSPNILDGPVKVTLRNTLGVVVYEREFEHIFYQEVKLSPLSRGVYVLNITVAESSFAQKLFLQ